jgi:hypothetical protein
MQPHAILALLLRTPPEVLEARRAARFTDIDNHAATASCRRYTMNPNEPNQPDEPATLAAFIEQHDKRAHAWWQQVRWTPDLSLAIAVGELQAVLSLLAIHSRYKGGASLEHCVVQFLAGRAALRRRRDSLQFVRSLSGHISTERDRAFAAEHIDDALRDFERLAEDARTDLAEIKRRLAAGEKMEDEDLDRVFGVLQDAQRILGDGREGGPTDEQS